MSRSAAAALRRGAPVFAALGDETRLRIVARLSSAREPLSISRVTEGEDLTRQAITKHLAVLAGAGLVHDIRRGREHLWELDPAALEAARSCLDHVSQIWDLRLERLKAFVER